MTKNMVILKSFKLCKNKTLSTKIIIYKRFSNYIKKQKTEWQKCDYLKNVLNYINKQTLEHKNNYL
jgi:hypothetical protein